MAECSFSRIRVCYHTLLPPLAAARLTAAAVQILVSDEPRHSADAWWGSSAVVVAIMVHEVLQMQWFFFSDLVRGGDVAREIAGTVVARESGAVSSSSRFTVEVPWWRWFWSAVAMVARSLLLMKDYLVPF